MIDTKTMLDYLSQLEKNNNKDWVASHKEERLYAEHEFEELVQELMSRIHTFDPSIKICSPKELSFKLVRDTRFSKDKSPYHPAFRAHISAKGKLPIPVGYFVFLRPNNKSFLGAGLFADMFPNATTMVRDYIAEHPQALADVIEKSVFAEKFQVMGSKLKNVPKRYDPKNQIAELLKHKSWYLESLVCDEAICDATYFLDHAATTFALMQPFNQYLNEALDGFQMPSRG